MGERVGAIETDGNAFHAGIHDHARHIFCDQRAVGGQGHAQFLVRGIARELKDVGAIKRFSAAQHQDGVGGFGNLVNDAERELGGKIVGGTKFGGTGAAVNATQIATLGDFPEDQARLASLRTCSGMIAIRWSHRAASLMPGSRSPLMEATIEEHDRGSRDPSHLKL